MDRRRPSLQWMVFEARKLGLRMERFSRNLSGTNQIELKESLTGFWRVLEYIPFKQLGYKDQSNDDKYTYA